jgi:dTDP-L-rhamnose 4-epimerase
LARVEGTVLVTGGSGFIGSRIVDSLVELGHPVRVLDRLHPRSHARAPAYENPGAEYVRGDVCDAATVERCVRGVDAVCHQAAMVGLGVDLDDTADYVRDNDLGTAVLLRGLARAGFGGRLVLASSMVVYGEGRYRCPADGLVEPREREPARLAAGRFEPACPRCGADLRPEPVPEDAPLRPANVYAATKVHQEQLCAVFARETGASVTALRYHNVYGPRMPRDTPYAGVASLFRSALERGEAPAVFEDGKQLRDFVHVHDVARANVLALTSPEPRPGAFNVASGERRTVGEMARALADAFGPGAPRPRTTGEYRLGDVRHCFASPERAAEGLGFRAEIGFAAGMAEFAQAPLRDAVPAGGAVATRR